MAADSRRQRQQERQQGRQQGRRQEQQQQQQRRRLLNPWPTLLAPLLLLLVVVVVVVLACATVASAFLVSSSPPRPVARDRGALAVVRASPSTPSTTHSASPCGGGDHGCGCGGCAGDNDSRAWMPSLTPAALAAVMAVAGGGGAATGKLSPVAEHQKGIGMHAQHPSEAHRGPVHVLSVVRGSGARAPKLDAPMVEVMKHMHRRMQFVDPGSCVGCVGSDVLIGWLASWLAGWLDGWMDGRTGRMIDQLFDLSTPPPNPNPNPNYPLHADFFLHVVTEETIVSQGGPAAFAAALPPGVAKADVVYFLGIEHPEVAARVEPCLHGVTNVVALHSCPALSRLTRIGPARPQGRFAGLWRALPLPTRRKKLLNIFDTVKSFYDRGHSDDLLYMILVVLNATIKNIPSVSEILKPVTLQALRCMVRWLGWGAWGWGVAGVGGWDCGVGLCTPRLLDLLSYNRNRDRSLARFGRRV
jgi:hypothetical protein